MRHIISVMLVLIGLSLVSAAYGEENVFQTVVAPDGVQRVDVVGGSYFFKPNHIIVKVNIPVEMKVSKESGFTPHNIVMDSPDAGITFEESLSTTPKAITFTPTKTGKYPFYCTKHFLFFGSHRAKGMEGVLEVVE